MSKRFALWRLPPVLVVHLKRFQFDRTSRRKLTNKVDFPLEGLDLTRYLAPTRWDHLKKGADCGVNCGVNGDNRDNGDNGGAGGGGGGGSEIKGDVIPEKENEEDEENDSYDIDDDHYHGNKHQNGDVKLVNQHNHNKDNNTTNNNNSNSSNSIEMSVKGVDGCLYDLYSVVHHVGALGGGHYVTTTRDRERGKKSEEARRMAREMSRSNLPSVSSMGSISPTSPRETHGRVVDGDKAGGDRMEGGHETNSARNNVRDKVTDTGTDNKVLRVKRTEKGTEKGAEKGVAVGVAGRSSIPPPGGQWWCYNDDIVSEVSSYLHIPFILLLLYYFTITFILLLYYFSTTSLSLLNYFYYFYLFNNFYLVIPPSGERPQRRHLCLCVRAILHATRRVGHACAGNIR